MFCVAVAENHDINMQLLQIHYHTALLRRKRVQAEQADSIQSVSQLGLRAEKPGIGVSRWLMVSIIRIYHVP